MSDMVICKYETMVMKLIPMGARTMKKTIGLFVALSLISSFSLARPASDFPEIRRARLAGLCKLWGAVKYFHPYLVYKDIDWDQALIETLPMVRQAETREEYAAALDHMLGFLADDISGVLPLSPSESTESSPDPGLQDRPSKLPLIEWNDDGTVVVRMNHYADFSDKAVMNELNGKLPEILKARGIIFDVRMSGNTDDEIVLYYARQAFPNLMRMLIPRKVTLPSYRYRMYSGLPDSQSSGGYYGGFVVRDVGAISPVKRDAAIPPRVFLVNQRTRHFMEVLSAVQALDDVWIIQDGDFRFAADSTNHVMDLPGNLQVRFMIGESINGDGSSGFFPDLRVINSDPDEETDIAFTKALDMLSGKIPSQHRPAALFLPAGCGLDEKSYAEMTYPSLEYRYLALFRYWNTIHYFFPYKHLLDDSWESVLEEFIPEMEAISNAEEYALMIRRLVSRIQDSHGFVSSRFISRRFGMHWPPIAVKEIEGKTVVTYIFEEAGEAASKLRVGDVIVSVDGEDVASRRSRMAPLIAASTPQALRMRIHQNMLMGPKNSMAVIRAENSRGETIEVSLERTMDYTWAYRCLRSRPTFYVMDNGFGYIDLQRLTREQVAEAFECLRSTPAIIFDMRGYPQLTAWEIGSRLVEEKTRAALFSRPEIHGDSISQLSTKEFYAHISPSNDWKYQGKIVVLINEEAISQAEHTCLILEACGGATFVGTPTVGANGDLIRITLPGGIVTGFTGHRVRHADGRQLQRLGIQPHVTVAPTIAGIRNGKDEVLDKAVDYLRK